VPHLERARAARPDAPEPRLALARAHALLGRPAEAAPPTR
jgi:hypothetical protein